MLETIVMWRRGVVPPPPLLIRERIFMNEIIEEIIRRYEGKNLTQVAIDDVRFDNRRLAEAIKFFESHEDTANMLERAYQVQRLLENKLSEN